MEIKVQHLTRIFGSTKALDDVSFTFSSGDIFGFIGPNGAGKTTAIRIMAGLDLPTAGDVLYDGISAAYYPEKIRQKVGYMPDTLPDHKDVTVWEYLDFCARGFRLRSAERIKRLKYVEEFTGTGDIRSKFLHDLSKGMKQRVSLARAIIHDPEVLIMDEPAAGLDPRARFELRNMLKQLANEKKAILLSSHILPELQDICNGAVIIEQGKLLSAGTLKQMSETLISGSELLEQKSTAVITLLCPGKGEELKQLLEAHPAVSALEVHTGGKFCFSLAEWEENLPPLMIRLFAEKFPITNFSKEEPGLEELFMRITTGKVQ
jgi:ABC-2 type transport system ATP-binding protein